MEQQAKPKSYLSVDASIFDTRSQREEIKLDVQLNRIRFDFPAGFNELELLDECRALKVLDKRDQYDPDTLFDSMYSVMMKMLTGKPVLIYMRALNDEYVEVAKFMVTDTQMNLRGVQFIAAFPIVAVWMTDFVCEILLKKFPLPSRLVPEMKSNGAKAKKARAKKQPQASS